MRKESYNSTLVFMAACLGILLFGIVLISLGSILPLLRERFGLSDLATGSLLTLLPFGLLIGSLVFGPIVDRYGYKILLLISSLMIFAGLEGIAFSAHIMILRLSILLISIGGGAINGATNAVAADTAEGDRGARLSLLGVFFGLGALGVPFLLGVLSDILPHEKILFWIGIFVLFPALFFLFIKFPPPKQSQGFPIKKAVRLLKDPWILLVGLVLFLQSGLEGLANNWSTTFLQENKAFINEHALFSLSCLVLGMTTMRLILGWALHKIKSGRVLLASIGISLTASLLIWFFDSLTATYVGMGLLGAGFAASFPVLMGYVAGKYKELSGTALSMVLVMALVGNMIFNYAMGLFASAFGTGILPLVIAGGVFLQFFLLIWVLKLMVPEERPNNT
jgi:MFS family permease